MLFIFLFTFLVANAAVLPHTYTYHQDHFEEIATSVVRINNEPSATSNAGIRVEVTTPAVPLQSSARSLDDTFAAQRKLVQLDSGTKSALPLDPRPQEFTAGEPNIEFILDSTRNKVRDGNTGPDCGPHLGQVPCPTSSSSSYTSVPATTVQVPLASMTDSSPCNAPDECARLSNEARPSCKTADDCTAGCAEMLADNTQALTVDFASTCVQESFCTCSVAAAEIVDDILIALGDIVCVVWNEALQDAAAILAFIVPYVGEAAEGVEAAKLFKAAKKVFKKGSKNCDLACPGHQYTAVDPMDADSMRDIHDCDG